MFTLTFPTSPQTLIWCRQPRVMGINHQRALGGEGGWLGRGGAGERACPAPEAVRHRHGGQAGLQGSRQDAGFRPKSQNQGAEETRSIRTPPSRGAPARGGRCPYLTPIVNMLRSCFPCSQPVNMIKPEKETKRARLRTHAHTCAHARTYVYNLRRAGVFRTPFPQRISGMYA